MPDRVREAIFNMLGARFECTNLLPPFSVADVFAGSGSMGLEALSRGAASCVFMERDPTALVALRKNIATLEAADRSFVVTDDAWQTSDVGPDGSRFALMFLDPPYAASDDVSEDSLVRRYLGRIDWSAADRPLVVLHHRASTPFEAGPTDVWKVFQSRTFGTNSIEFIE